MMLLVFVAHLGYVGADTRTARALEAMSIAEQLGDGGAYAAASADFALTLTNVAGVLAAAERAIAAASGARNAVALGMALHIAASALLRLRRFADATELLDRHCVLGTRRFGLYEAHVLFERGRLVMLQGDLEAAARYYGEAEQATIRTGSPSGRSTAWFGQAEVARLSGRPADAYAGFARCLPVDLIVEPGETGAVRMMIVWTACQIGEIEVAEHHAAVLRDEYALESSLTRDVTGLAACAQGAEGLLALTKGMDATAETALRLAVGFWADCGCWDLVADLIDRLPEIARLRHDGPRLHELAASIRRGTLSMYEAIASV
jgi:tetratricopeptide (TPR) repeat protein